MAGKIVAIEGIDGSGKGTQSRLLVERLQSEGKKVALLSFPRYSETRFGAAIGDFLNGRFGDLESVSPWLISVLYAGDRFESKTVIEQAVAENDLLVFDRYTSSNIAHQGAKVKAAEREEIINWIEDIEHDVFGLPRPNLNLLLDVSVATSQALIRKKSPRDYTDAAADLQESNVSYMESVHACYQQLAQRPEWTLVACEDTDGVKSVDVIAEELRQAIQHLV